MKPYWYGLLFIIAVSFIYWYSSNQSAAGYNECKADLSEAKAEIESAVAKARADEEKKLAEFRKQADKDKRKFENELAKYKNNPQVKKWGSGVVPDVIADDVWLRNNRN